MSGFKSMLVAAVAVLFLVGGPPPARVGMPEANRIEIEYGDEDNPEHATVRRTLMEHRVLEEFRDFLGMLILPRPLKLEFDGCEGEPDAWYEPTRYAVTICYEYIQELRKKAPQTTTADGVTPEDAVMGPVMEVVLHEVAHAVFHMLELPILGREEDAADQFAAVLLLQMSKSTARRVIAATAHMYWREAHESPLTAGDLASSHSPPIQRFYQLVCIAYGHDPELFGYVRETYLDPERADECPDETQFIKSSFWKLMSPHIDERARRQLEIDNWVPAARKLLRSG